MSKLLALAAQITDADRRAGAAINKAILDEHLPAFLDARKVRSPERLAADAEGVKRQLAEFKARRVSMPTTQEKPMGQNTSPKGLQLRALREANAKATENKPAAATKKPATPKAAPAKPEAETTEESTMSRKTQKTTKSKARTAVKAATTKTAKAGEVRPGSKLEAIVALLKRKNGCTTKDVLEATGWPAVSMPQQAKAAKLKLIKEKDGKVTRYRVA